MIALCWREDMQHKVAKINGDPAIAWLAFNPAFNVKSIVDGFIGVFEDTAQHAVARAGADHKIIGK